MRFKRYLTEGIDKKEIKIGLVFYEAYKKTGAVRRHTITEIDGNEIKSNSEICYTTETGQNIDHAVAQKNMKVGKMPGVLRKENMFIKFEDATKYADKYFGQAATRKTRKTTGKTSIKLSGRDKVNIKRLVKVIYPDGDWQNPNAMGSVIREYDLELDTARSYKKLFDIKKVKDKWIEKDAPKELKYWYEITLTSFGKDVVKQLGI
jgi:hypothetical protein